MTLPRFVTFFLCVAAATAGVSAQETVPTQKANKSFASQTLVAGGSAVSIHLLDYFEIPTVTDYVVQFDTTLGKFNVELKSADAPATVNNFLTYVLAGSYQNTIVHRSAALGANNTNRIIQGGGYVPSGESITRRAPIALEYKLLNARGTIAMARTSEPNSATSEWFFNVDDNTTALGAANGGGYAVFGRVLGSGMTVVDAIAGVTRYNIGGAFTSIPLQNIQPGQTAPVDANLIKVNSARPVPVYADLANPASVMSFSATSGNTSVVTTEMIASTLTLRPLVAGSTTVTVRAVDTNGNALERSFAVTVVATPQITTAPLSQTITAGQNGALTAAATAGATLQWQRNGRDLSGIDSTNVNITDMQPGLTGLYTVVASLSGASSTSAPAILGVSTISKVIGGGQEVGTPNITHPNGNIFDQVLLTGSAEAITADAGQITRTSFIDQDHDIVQVEYSGPGTLAILMDGASGPAVPTNYNQPNTQYVRGRASIVITGATENSHLAVFTVGKLTAYDPTGAYDVSKPMSSTNNPANNGNPIFKSGVTYGGVADIARIVIRSADGKFGSIRAADTLFYDVAGYTGIYAPGVTVVDRVVIGDICAYTNATPVLILGAAPAELTLITGGDLYQDNGQPIQLSGVTKLKFQAGTDSHGNGISAKLNRGILFQNGQNVTAQVVVNPQ